MRSTTRLLTSAAMLSALLLTGCSATGGSDSMAGMDHNSGSSDSSAEAATHNAADEMFVTMMIPHHEQAIEMADALLAKDGIDRRVVELAEQIAAAQGPEIETMRGWLEDWGVEPRSESGGMDHGGMMSEDSMAELAEASGAEAARLFLSGMIVHHRGAIDMAEPVLEDGENPDVLALAQQVIDGQSAEIATMERLLKEI
ncbi:DUF305 domain-containing protein [Leucobacter chromiireducens]|uniref:DUF305 domain-containing protein n=1 Tax=Leucobacter chromiireducens TaxID=283877 RepID=UPI000F634027|nr:DUF305 domain-containing protein [Leucobacter chromiireducens]